jgi:hypothetical protein
MIFHDIDSYNFDAQGPIRIERVATLPASFTAAADTGRVLYTEDTQYFYYGDADSWVRFSTYDELYAHITQTSDVHGASGSVIGSHTFDEHKNATTAHGSDGSVVGLNTLTEHTSSSVAHNADGDIIGLNTLTSQIINYISIHKIDDNAHPLATVSAAGFMPRLPNDIDLYLNGMGNWAEPINAPIGSIIAVAGTTVPQYFFECNGASLLTTDYLSLYNAIGYRYGYVESGISPYGSGSDGDLVISSGTTSVSRTMYYNNLTIEAGAILQTNGRPIYVRGTLINNGTIKSNWPSNASAGGAGGAGASDYALYSVPGGGGGAGGEGGANSNSVTLYAKTIYNYGTISADGTNGAPGGSGGRGQLGPGFTLGWGLWQQSSGGGGGGAGGRGGNAGNIYLTYETKPVHGNIHANRGEGGGAGSAGGVPALTQYYYPYGSGNPGSAGQGGGGNGGNSCWQAFTGNNAGPGSWGAPGAPGSNGLIYQYVVSDVPVTRTHFKIPDYRGFFLKGWNHGSGNDINAGSRTNSGDGTIGDNIGTRSNEISRAAGMTDVYVMYCIKYR